MKFADAIDEYMDEMRRQGRINSPNSEMAYRRCLEVHCDDVDNRDPSKTGRNDIKCTLRRWDHANTQRQKHSILVSFYDWTMHEGYRETNPARAVLRAKPKDVSVYRPTLEEVVRIIDATTGDQASRRRERWVIHLGLLAGLRRQELCGLQGRHLQRDGFVWVSTDIAKREKERWVPILPELEAVVEEIRTLVPAGAYVTPSRRNVSWDNTEHAERPHTPISPEGLYKMVKRVGERAGLGHEIGPHTLRHAFGDHIARYAGLRAAQAMLGHASVSTTEEAYTGRVSLDELAVSVHGFRFRREAPAEGHAELSAGQPPSMPRDDANAR